MALAPVGITVYNRPLHLQQTISSLLDCELSNETEVFFFIDAPRMVDLENCLAVKKFILKINGFKKVHLIERQVNDFHENVLHCIDYLLNKYGKMIYLEDDIVVSPCFLKSMNRGLEIFESDVNVFSITGYRPPLTSFCHDEDVLYAVPRFTFWGMGIWKRSWDASEKRPRISRLVRLMVNPSRLKFFWSGGADLILTFVADTFHKVEALDARLNMSQVELGMYTLYPSSAIAMNIGHDGSGIHCGTTDRFEVDGLEALRCPSYSSYILDHKDFLAGIAKFGRKGFLSQVRGIWRMLSKLWKSR